MTRTLTFAGAASAGQVWRLYTTPRLWGSWAPHITGVDSSTPVIEAGTHGTVTLLRVLRAHFVVSAVDHSALVWSWNVRCGPLHMSLTHSVTDESHGTSTSLVVSGPAVMTDLYLPVASRAMRRLVTMRPTS